MGIHWLGFGRSLVLLSTLLLSGCQYLPSLPANPFRPSATAEPTAISTPVTAAPPSPSPSQAAAAAAFMPFWVKNHRLTEMWSGAAGQPNVTSFGTTSAQFCSFQVVQPPAGTRLYVLNPYSNNYFWIDADAIGPVPNPPERRPGPKPADQNCTEAIYEG